jgi:hypothetical protein
MILADAWSAVGGIAAVVAALAALITIWYARATVGEARTARREATAAHAEDLAEQRRALETSAASHQQQMQQRAQALATELKLQRIVQLERIAEVLTDLADIARDEAIAPPPRPVSYPTAFRMSRIPAALARLRTAVALLDALGGPRLAAASQLAGQAGGTPPETTLSSALAALQEIETLARNEGQLKVEPPG